MNTNITSTSLYFREGISDKEYHVAIEPEGEGYIVTFAYGRRGNTLTTGRKTQSSVSLDEATAIHDKLIREKSAKGYRPNGETKSPDRTAASDGTDSGIRCQLLNPVEADEVNRHITSPRYCLQEKQDGRRLMIRKRGEEITGINRRGLLIPVPESIRRDVAKITGDLLIDGEAVGDTLHAFDILDFHGTDLRQHRYMDRFKILVGVIPRALDALRWVSTAIDPDDKLEIYHELRITKREAVVFKDMDAPYSPGRPNSGGTQLKFKFVESASFIVTGINAQRSVTLGLHASNGERIIPAGNVTIPPNHAIPEVGRVVDVRYLLAYQQSGSVYQPVYLGERDDIPASECVVEQLKYKSEPNSETAA